MWKMHGTYKNIIQIGLASLADNTTTNVLQYCNIFAISYRVKPYLHLGY